MLIFRLIKTDTKFAIKGMFISLDFHVLVELKCFKKKKTFEHNIYLDFRFSPLYTIIL